MPRRVLGALDAAEKSVATWQASMQQKLGSAERELRAERAKRPTWRRWIVVAALYSAFLGWYGTGNAAALTADEQAVALELAPALPQLAQLASLGYAGEICEISFLKFRRDESAGAIRAGDARRRYRRLWMAVALPRASHPVFASTWLSSQPPPAATDAACAAHPTAHASATVWDAVSGAVLSMFPAVVGRERGGLRTDIPAAPDIPAPQLVRSWCAVRLCAARPQWCGTARFETSCSSRKTRSSGGVCSRPLALAPPPRVALPRPVRAR